MRQPTQPTYILMQWANYFKATLKVLMRFTSGSAPKPR
jgi:hypothetical protein